MQTKIKLGAIAVAMSAALAATSASAINVDGSPALGDGTGAGELFFSLWDQGRNQSFILDLNVPVQPFVANDGSFVGTSVTSSALAAFVAGGDIADMNWNIAGVSNILSLTEFFTVSTIDPDSVKTQAPDTSNVQFAVFSAGQYVSAANQALISDPSGDYGIFDINDGLAYFGGGAWGFSWGGNYAFDNAPNVGEDATTWIDRADISQTELTAGRWTFDAATGTVAYVPVPAAVWLFGSALGLLGAVRRRLAKA